MWIELKKAFTLRYIIFIFKGVTNRAEYVSYCARKTGGRRIEKLRGLFSDFSKSISDLKI